MIVRDSTIEKINEIAKELLKDNKDFLVIIDAENGKSGITIKDRKRKGILEYEAR
jgi:hypothetical protein